MARTITPEHRLATTRMAQTHAAQTAQQPAFEPAARAVIAKLAAAGTFTAEDVLAHLAEQGITPARPQAIGPVMARAARILGLVRVGWATSTKEGSHTRAGLRVWATKQAAPPG